MRSRVKKFRSEKNPSRSRASENASGACSLDAVEDRNSRFPTEDTSVAGGFDAQEEGRIQRCTVEDAASDAGSFDDVEEDGCDSFNEFNPTYSKERDEFDDLHAGMLSDHKWALSKDYVEDLIYDIVVRDQSKYHGCVLLHFVLDISDKSPFPDYYNNIWEQVKNAFPPAPTPELLPHVRPFLKAQTVDALARSLTDTSAPDEFSSRVLWNWALTVHSQIYRLFSSRIEPLTAQQNECWYTANVWSYVVDSLLLGLSSVNIVRSEVHSVASTRAKNRDRKHTHGRENRQKVGPKFDGIIRIMWNDGWEIGALETGKSYDGPNSTKWIRDLNKLQLALRNMLLRLHDEFGDGDVTKLETVGFLTAGLHLQLIRCWGKRKGGVVLCKRSKMVRFPTSFGEIDKLYELMTVVLTAKEIVERVQNIVVDGPKSTEGMKAQKISGFTIY